MTWWFFIYAEMFRILNFSKMPNTRRGRWNDLAISFWIQWLSPVHRKMLKRLLREACHNNGDYWSLLNQRMTNEVWSCWPSGKMSVHHCNHSLMTQNQKLVGSFLNTLTEELWGLISLTLVTDSTFSQDQWHRSVKYQNSYDHPYEHAHDTDSNQWNHMVFPVWKKNQFKWFLIRFWHSITPENTQTHL